MVKLNLIMNGLERARKIEAAGPDLRNVVQRRYE
jgi:hypothetical protein